jgi:hypothetical protein
MTSHSSLDRAYLVGAYFCLSLTRGLGDEKAPGSLPQGLSLRGGKRGTPRRAAIIPRRRHGCEAVVYTHLLGRYNAMTTASRRAVLAGAIATPIAGTVTTLALAETDDAELLRLAAEVKAAYEALAKSSKRWPLPKRSDAGGG